MKIAIEHEIASCNPDVLGELLREITFVGEGFGCYTTFDVRADAQPLPELFVKKYFDYEDDGYPLDYTGYSYPMDDGTIEVMWVWDGDGNLIFRCLDSAGNVVRVIGNSDCKKQYDWKDIPTNHTPMFRDEVE